MKRKYLLQISSNHIHLFQVQEPNHKHGLIGMSQLLERILCCRSYLSNQQEPVLFHTLSILQLTILQNYSLLKKNLNLLLSLFFCSLYRHIHLYFDFAIRGKVQLLISSSERFLKSSILIHFGEGIFILSINFFWEILSTNGLIALRLGTKICLLLIKFNLSIFIH